MEFGKSGRVLTAVAEQGTAGHGWKRRADRMEQLQLRQALTDEMFALEGAATDGLEFVGFESAPPLVTASVIAQLPTDLEERIDAYYAPGDRSDAQAVSYGPAVGPKRPNGFSRLGHVLTELFGMRPLGHRALPHRALPWEGV